ncbi:metallophosphoesterase family protein [Humitalea sp. 24SJ18S-53]|uniref:metallophosphoesterase family protein n=1 Tax=Humitalea sp. 24SJ18S-53 TaxID=3422307 RepID=UPI003D670D65
MTLRLAHLSDLHFGEAGAEAIASLGAALRDAAPDAVLVSGDLTRRARSAEFAAAAGFLGGFDVPVLAVPGNHDIPRTDLWTRFLRPLAPWQKFHGLDREPELECGDVVVLGLDTVQRAHWHMDWSAGGLSQRRLDRLAARLATYRGRRIIVLCHHPLRHPAWAIGREPAFGAGAAVALLRDAGALAILCGHLHRADAPDEGAGAPLQFIAPSALSPRTKGSPNGWNLVTIDAAGLRVETQWLHPPVTASAPPASA